MAAGSLSARRPCSEPAGQASPGCPLGHSTCAHCYTTHATASQMKGDHSRGCPPSALAPCCPELRSMGTGSKALWPWLPRAPSRSSSPAQHPGASCTLRPRPGPGGWGGASREEPPHWPRESPAGVSEAHPSLRGRPALQTQSPKRPRECGFEAELRQVTRARECPQLSPGLSWTGGLPQLDFLIEGSRTSALATGTQCPTGGGTETTGAWGSEVRGQGAERPAVSKVVAARPPLHIVSGVLPSS